jgi:hypothetical protein
VRRSLRPHDKDRYDADLALARARQRAGRDLEPRLSLDIPSRQLVQDKLELEWSLPNDTSQVLIALETVAELVPVIGGQLVACSMMRPTATGCSCKWSFDR